MPAASPSRMERMSEGGTNSAHLAKTALASAAEVRSQGPRCWMARNSAESREGRRAWRRGGARGERGVGEEAGGPLQPGGEAAPRQRAGDGEERGLDLRREPHAGGGVRVEGVRRPAEEDVVDGGRQQAEVRLQGGGGHGGAEGFLPAEQQREQQQGGVVA